MRPIEFNLPDEGLREIFGKVYVEDGFLVIHVRNALLGEFDKEKREIRIEPAALKEVRLDTGILKDRLVLRPADDRLLQAMPGDHAGEVTLRVWRNRRNDLRSVVQSLQQAIDAA